MNFKEPDLRNSKLLYKFEHKEPCYYIAEV